MLDQSMSPLIPGPYLTNTQNFLFFLFPLKQKLDKGTPLLEPCYPCRSLETWVMYYHLLFFPFFFCFKSEISKRNSIWYACWDKYSQTMVVFVFWMFHFIFQNVYQIKQWNWKTLRHKLSMQSLIMHVGF